MNKNKIIILLLIISLGVFFFFISKEDDKISKNNSTIELKAAVKFTGTQFVIINNDSFNYTNTKMKVNNKFFIKGYTIKSGETYTVGMLQFADDEGNRFDLMKKPQNFSISCDLEKGGDGFYYAEWK